MSITVSTCDEICHSPTNSSKAKMLYTFSKQNRFPKRRIIMCDKFYDVKDLRTSRTAAFGFGHKYDFTKDTPKSPPSNTYNIKSEFEKNEKKGFGFGFGRQEMEITGPFVLARKEKNPGPGSYELKSTLNETSTFSLRGKDYHEDQEKIKLPGPGYYPVTFAINEKGKYFLSKYKNSCIRSFNTLSERVNFFENKVPGPGAYPIDKVSFSPEGKYPLSKMPSSQTRRFGTSNRIDLSRKTDTPGPGNYRLPSEFGHYQSKSAAKKPKTEQVGRRIGEKGDKQNQSH